VNKTTNNLANNTNQHNNGSQHKVTDTTDRWYWRQLKNFTNENLSFKVQIGAYRYPKNFKYEFLKKLGKQDEQVLLEDDITRITLGRFTTLQEAYEFRDKVKQEGVNDAFVTAVYKGKRYYLKDLKALLKDLMPAATAEMPELENDF
ncbi:MAG TPA: SPOR domain-containing protein, partial [Flavobacteriales bacterium]|nr:SPOR domain-containing protein [Flavobacteriales bacterium]